MNFPCAKLPHPAHAPYLHPCRQLHHLRWPLDHMASSSCALNLIKECLQPTPHMMFLFISSPDFISSASGIPAVAGIHGATPSRPNFAVKPLPFASS